MDDDFWYVLSASLFFVTFVVLLIIQFVRDRSVSREEPQKVPDDPPRSEKPTQFAARIVLVGIFVLVGSVLRIFGFLLSSDHGNTGGNSIAAQFGIVVLVVGLPLAILGLAGVKKLLNGSDGEFLLLSIMLLRLFAS